ncbi:MAG: glycosyltransferase family 2 protein [Terricaulis sp.]
MTLLVVIPCLNEEAHLRRLLDALHRDPAANDARIVVADGGSADSSVAIVREAARTDARIVLMHNPQRIQSAGVNAAVRAYGGDGEFFVRVDAHAAYPDGFLSNLLSAQRESGADAVTVSMHARAARGACFQQANAAAQNSALGTGGSPHRHAGERCWVEHGHHALMRVKSFHAAGGYDESFSHNEDAEFDKRLTDSGGRILLASDIVIDYFPRATATALARQYFKFGEGRARTSIKHRMPLKPRQMIPALIAPAVALSAVLTPFTPLAAVPALAWITACLGYGVILGIKQRQLCACAAGVLAMIMHFAWSVGFLRGAAANVGRSPRMQNAL